jgi:hypothetical protein
VLDRATQASDGDFAANLTRVAVAYVQFATDNPALLELMFTSKHQVDASDELRLAANASFDRLFALVQAGQASGELIDGDLQQIGTVLFATMQGITSLANTDMVDKAELDDLTAYCVQSLLFGLTPRSSATTLSG